MSDTTAREEAAAATAASRLLPARLITMVLAGGMGERLLPITSERSKPAVPFGGTFRIIDFTLTSCLFSGIRRAYVLTQYLAVGLNRHLQERWSFLPRELGEFIEAVPSKLRTPQGVYRGTADAVFRNLDLLEDQRPEVVLILSGDHIYRAAYDRMVAQHLNSGADATVLTGETDIAEASQFGVVRFHPDGRIREFVEKPSDPRPYADADGRCAINLGVYCFSTQFLVRRLVADAKTKSAHDFGKNILPTSVEMGKVASCPFSSVCPDARPYWRDVGSIESYFQAQMDLVATPAAFELRDPRWGDEPRFEERLPARVHLAGTREAASLVSSGATIGRARVTRAVISPSVRIEDGATVDEAVLLDGVTVGRGAKLHRVVVEASVTVPPGARLAPRRGAKGREGVLVVSRGYPF